MQDGIQCLNRYPIGTRRRGVGGRLELGHAKFTPANTQGRKALRQATRQRVWAGGGEWRARAPGVHALCAVPPSSILRLRRHASRVTWTATRRPPAADSRQRR